MRVTPVSFLEITRHGTKIRPVLDWTRIGIALITVLIPMIGVGGFKRFLRRGRIGTPSLNGPHFLRIRSSYPVR